MDCKKIQSVHPKGNQSWIFIGRTDAEAETPRLWPPDAKNWRILKRPRCWERLKVGREGNNRGWDGWMVSPTQWTRIWASSRSWWWTGKPGVLQSMGSQRVGHDWATELNWEGSVWFFLGRLVTLSQEKWHLTRHLKNEKKLENRRKTVPWSKQ